MLENVNFKTERYKAGLLFYVASHDQFVLFSCQVLYWDRLHHQKGLTFVFFGECTQIFFSLTLCLCSSDNHTMIIKRKVVCSLGAHFEISLHKCDSGKNVIR